MNILQELLGAQDGRIVGQLADQFGIDSSDAGKALSNLIPAIAGGIKKTAQSQSGLESLIAKVAANQEVRRAADSPELLGRPQATEAGNDILGDIFGSKDVSRSVADQTARSTGLDLGILKKMLPLVAGLVMSSLSKHGEASAGGLSDLLRGNSNAGTAVGNPSASAGGGFMRLLKSLFSGRGQRAPGGGLESLLDFDGDGNIADDVLDMAKKMF